MSLTRMNFKGASIEVPTDDGPVTLKLRGLSFEDVGTILYSQGSTLEALWHTLVQDRPADGLFAPGDVVSSILYEAPLLAAHIIALAVDEPDEIERAAALPVWVQVAALEKIWDLTFAGGDSLKKALGFVGAAYRSQQARPTESTTASPTSTPG